MSSARFFHLLPPSLAVIAFTAASPATAATFTTFDPPGSVGTYPYSINASGAITGTYETPDNKAHGFIRAADGAITTFDPQGSIITQPFAIDANGRVAGELTPHNRSRSHGFIREPDGSFTVFDATPGAVYTKPVGFDATSPAPLPIITGSPAASSGRRPEPSRFSTIPIRS